MRILLAEDDSVSRRILASQLSKMQLEVEQAEDGLTAWTAFQRAKPDLVITDWIMPHIDGPELCRRIRNSPSSSYTYIIILTAIDRKHGYLEGMEAGADDFVTKPGYIVELNARIKVAQRILALQKHVSKLEGLLPICPKCKKIRTDEQRWQAVESYIMKHTDALFSHGICPDCYERLMKPQLNELRMKAGANGQKREP